jgi:hypothetical protein
MNAFNTKGHEGNTKEHEGKAAKRQLRTENPFN